MLMSEPFVILHLSDAHIGNPRYELDSLDVLEPLVTDAQTVARDRRLKPNLIVFNGDLAYGEIARAPLVEQYKKARVWIGRLLDALGCSFEQTPFLLVPGNHDINRLSIGDDQKDWIAKLKDSGADEV